MISRVHTRTGTRIPTSFTNMSPKDFPTSHCKNVYISILACECECACACACVRVCVCVCVCVHTCVRAHRKMSGLHACICVRIQNARWSKIEPAARQDRAAEHERSTLSLFDSCAMLLSRTRLCPAFARPGTQGPRTGPLSLRSSTPRL